MQACCAMNEEYGHAKDCRVPYVEAVVEAAQAFTYWGGASRASKLFEVVRDLDAFDAEPHPVGIVSYITPQEYEENEREAGGYA